MRVLDLYCGLGGWSEGFHAEGFECLGVDIVNVGYPYDLILQDVRTLDGENLKGEFDVIVGSPPCRDFSLLANFSKDWKRPRDLKNGLSMVNAFLDIVKDAKPKFWIMENVSRLTKYFPIYQPKAHRIEIAKHMHRSFWGDIPNILIPCDLNKIANQKDCGKLRRWTRSKLPFSFTNPIAKEFKRRLLCHN